MVKVRKECNGRHWMVLIVSYTRSEVWITEWRTVVAAYYFI